MTNQEIIRADAAEASDYIERKRVIDLITSRYENPEICAQEINEIPAADVASVVHGKWEWHGPCGDSNGKFWATCPVCKVRQRLGDYERFCPNCGAKMDKEE